MDSFDAVVIGGGNAGLCAAIAAAEFGSSVILVERAPVERRGGNSFFTAGAFRFPYQHNVDLIMNPSLRSGN